MHTVSQTLAALRCCVDFLPADVQTVILVHFHSDLVVSHERDELRLHLSNVCSV